MHDLFLRACRRESVERTPIWIMRQAGRYLAEYRAVRERVDFLTLCKTPQLAAQVTLQPVERLGVDAAILFSDILIPAGPMGFRIDFRPGPVLDAPVRSRADIDRIRVFDPEQELPYVYESIRLVRRELEGRVPLIGFGAAPFTLAVYLVEGGGSKSFDRIRRLLYGDPASAHRLLERVTEVTALYLSAQVWAGAQAVQLFDTWAGLLAGAEYREFALRYARQVLERLQPTGVPRIYFALDAAHLLDDIAECGAEVVGVDWRVGLSEASRRLGNRFVLQGNLDPCVLLASPATIEVRAGRILEEARGLPGHVFNLGHGILPETPVEHAQALVRAVQLRSAR
ncbi:MAG TPA: uroporphyrinogen decarboxylase [Candidatus Polarisedimenticolaceae bacterium]|nr:uroporphyrinogen decarboxylase [Candidatus Polarisedimenticolaceae bacterium]